MAIITCQDLAFAHEGSLAAHGLNFSVNAGDYLCIVGENGSGKTTLVQGLLGLIPPRQGTLIREGLRAVDTGYLPQQTELRKDFPAGVFEVVLSGCLARRGLRPFYTRKDKTEAEENLHRLGIADLKQRCYRELSGGQQRRVLLARALCAARKLLLLDEPFAGLDPKAVQRLYSLLQSINRAGVTIIMVSHDLSGALENASHILRLRGEQVFFGPAAQYAEKGAPQ